MSSSVFASRDTHTLTLESGDTITIKEELNVVEVRRAFIGVKDVDRDFQFAKEYLVGWSFKDDAGNDVPYAPEMLEALKPRVFNEIVLAISDYQKEQSDARPTKAGSRPKRTSR